MDEGDKSLLRRGDTINAEHRGERHPWGRRCCCSVLTGAYKAQGEDLGIRGMGGERRQSAQHVCTTFRSCRYRWLQLAAREFSPHHGENSENAGRITG